MKSEIKKILTKISGNCRQRQPNRIPKCPDGTVFDDVTLNFSFRFRFGVVSEGVRKLPIIRISDNTSPASGARTIIVRLRFGI